MAHTTLPGFREFYPAECSRRNFLFTQFRRVARAFCFEEYDGPILEPLDLFVEKSGPEIVGQLFNFEDKGGRAVALRPEMTPTLARLVGAKINSLRRPVKWFSIGEQFRYERPQKGRLRSFYQYNVDVLGDPSVAVDAELITLLVQSIAVFGLNHSDFKVRLSDRNLWLLLMEALEVDAEQQLPILSIVDKLARNSRAKTLDQLLPILGASSENFLQNIERFMQIDSIDLLESCFLRLHPNTVLWARITQRLEEWRRLQSLLAAAGVADFIQIDLSIVRGLAYYTGFVFEAFEYSGTGRALAGGGRYDRLVQQLGGPDVPAVGFAIGDVTLMDLLISKGRLPELRQQPDFVAIFDGDAARMAAISDANSARVHGYAVEYALKPLSFSKQFKLATQKGARFALIYGSDELSKNSVKIRDFSTGVEQLFVRDYLLEVLVDVMHAGLTSAEH
jgi:histidyl-tRNA synthetase